MFFSFRGRLNRKPYWLRSLALIAIFLVGVTALFSLFGIGVAAMQDPLAVLGDLGIALVLVLVLYVVLLVAAISLTVRRLHDRDKSGWWVLVFFLLPSVLQTAAAQTPDLALALQLAAAAISIWALVELGFLRGTPGPNRYGPDPLASRTAY